MGVEVAWSGYVVRVSYERVLFRGGVNGVKSWFPVLDSLR